MRKSSVFTTTLFAFFILALSSLVWASFQYDDWAQVKISAFPVVDGDFVNAFTAQDWQFPQESEVLEIPAFVNKSLEWLASAQAEDGGWGAGLHHQQNVRDPKAVKTDPATTAFVGMAMMRVGNTASQNPYANNIGKANQYLLVSVENTPDGDKNITELTGTQPQQKLGGNVDVALAAQFFARILPHLNGDAVMQNRVVLALDQCVAMLEASQLADGSWNQNGWAPVLNSAMGDLALELAQRVGRPVDPRVFQRSQSYQRNNVLADGSVSTESAANIPLYALACTQRSTATSANTTRRALAEEFQQTTDTLSLQMAKDALGKQGISEERAAEMAAAYVANVNASRQVVQDDVQRGFGNNGGEEFLSHMLTSESLAAMGGEEWSNWQQRMTELYGQIQNENGTWSGHHCITSPVFCTAAVIMALSADREAVALL